MRDPVKLRQEMENRKRKILDAAFCLYSEKSIEMVTMQMVADAAGVGVATVFRYYPAKEDLVIDVCADRWKQFQALLYEKRPEEYVKSLPAIDRIAFTLDCYIELYRNHRKLLAFNDNFNHYISTNHTAPEKLEFYRAVMNMTTERFHWMYEKAKEDHSFRTDLPEEELQRVIFHTMMAACAHYSGGIVWNASRTEDYTRELTAVKNMILDYIRKQ